MSVPPPNYSPQQNDSDIVKDSMYPNANIPTEGGFPPSPNMANAYPQPPPKYSESANIPHQNAPLPQPHQVGGTTTYVYVNEQMLFGPSPMHVQCPHCHQAVMSKIKYSAGVMTWIVFGVCLFFGCWLGCCLIPFCMDSCQDVDHFCTNCNAFLGNYKRI